MNKSVLINSRQFFPSIITTGQAKICHTERIPKPVSTRVFSLPCECDTQQHLTQGHEQQLSIFQAAGSWPANTSTTVTTMSTIQGPRC